MKLVIITILVTALAVSGAAQAKPKPAKVRYDAKLAKRLGGTDGGMKNYVFVILKTGPKDGDFKGKERDDIFAGHMANINRLADAGQLAVAGPFGKNDKDYRGLFIFNVQTVEEARELVETDPVIKNGLMIAELTPWYGSASLMATPDIHKRITKPEKPKKTK